MPRVLVVLTSFNHAAHLGESIDSVLGQSFGDFELVVLDDASTDDSWKLIAGYADPRMRAFASQAPGEVVHRTNDAFAGTGCEYLALQHSDDVWTPQKLQRQVDYLDAHPEVGAVFTWVQVIDETGAAVPNDWFNRPNQSRWAWLNELFNQKNTLNHPSALIRKRCYDEAGGYRYGLAQTDDADFWSRILVRHPIHVLAEKLTLHRIFSDKSNVSGDRPEVAVRTTHEWRFLRENLLALRGFDEIVQVFPELEDFRREAGFNAKFLLAMACVRSPHRSAWPLGLEWLFELLNDKAQRDQIAALYGFTDLSFVKLSASLDSYQLESVRQQGQAIAQYEQRLQGVLSEYATLQGVVSQRDAMLQDAASEHARNLQRLQGEYIEAAQLAQAAHAEALQHAQAAHAEALAASEARAQALQLARARAQEAAAEAGRRAQTQRERADAASARADAQEARANAAQQEAAAQSARALESDGQRQAIAARLAALESSSSWRATAPLRRFLADRPRTAQAIRRAAKLAWWTARLQLLQKLREWRARRRTAAQAPVPVPVPVPESAAPAPGPQAMAMAPAADWIPEPSAEAAPAPAHEEQTLSPEAARLSDWLHAAKGCAACGDHAMLPHALLVRYFAGLALSTATASTWIRLLEAPATLGLESSPGFAVLAAELEANPRVAEIAGHLLASPLFDAAFYREQLLLEGSDADAARHYLLVGEPLGICPSRAFDPGYYGRKYPDVAEAGMNCLFHYTIGGQREGRRATMPPIAHRAGAAPIDPRKENVILVVHETSRTGAPILGWNIAVLLARKYNVFSVLLGPGALTPEFEAISCETIGPFDGVHTAPLEAELGLAPLLRGRAFKYAIVNSIESRVTVEVCARRAIPTLLLVHEYGSYVWPASALCKALDAATEVVFPAASVARSSMQVHPPLRRRNIRVEAQGMSLLPSGPEDAAPPVRNPLVEALARRRAEGTLIVTGAGSVNIRKGVDVFIGVAADVKRLGGSRPIHFVWVGGGYRPNDDMGYSVYLKEQMARADVEDFVTFIDEVPDLEPIYAMSDIFMLASRLDPLPNVSIDAAQRGIPTVCFREASGMADLLMAEPETAVGVVPYMDTRAAAAVILQLASDDEARARLGEATRQMAAEAFDMARYVQRLDRLGSAHAAGGAPRPAPGERSSAAAAAC